MIAYIVHQDNDSPAAFTTLNLAFDYVQKELQGIKNKKYVNCDRKVNPRSVCSINTWKRHIKEDGDYYFEVYGTTKDGHRYDNWYVIKPVTINEEIENVKTMEK